MQSDLISSFAILCFQFRSNKMNKEFMSYYCIQFRWYFYRLLLNIMALKDGLAAAFFSLSLLFILFSCLDVCYVIKNDKVSVAKYRSAYGL